MKSESEIQHLIDELKETRNNFLNIGMEESEIYILDIIEIKIQTLLTVLD